LLERATSIGFTAAKVNHQTAASDRKKLIAAPEIIQHIHYDTPPFSTRLLGELQKFGQRLVQSALFRQPISDWRPLLV
jgi:hypothetical protein